MHHSFEDIRPFNDNEAKDVLGRIANDDATRNVITRLFPEVDMHEFREKTSRMDTVSKFQHYLCHPITERLLDVSSRGLTYSGLEHIDPADPPIFISNHRDIILDSALLDFILMDRDYRPAYHAVGNNLLAPGVVSDVLRMNKNFIIHRNVPRRKVFVQSQKVSEYIRHILTTIKEPVWLAQSEGRAKDGNDRTQTGLLKMVGFCARDDYKEYFTSLNIMPVAISYEYDPCDFMKARELHARSLHGSYKKRPGEDVQSILKGLTGFKGRIHLCIDTSLDMTHLKGISRRNTFFNEAAALVDKRIHTRYRLWPSNYVAADCLNGSSEYTAHYSEEEKREFTERIESYRPDFPQEDPDRFLHILYSIYANPVFNSHR